MKPASECPRCRGVGPHQLDDILCDTCVAAIRGPVAERPRRFGPKDATHPTVGVKCHACGDTLQAGDFTALVPLGPGADPDERVKARAGRPYNGVAVEVHYACATGEEGRS